MVAGVAQISLNSRISESDANPAVFKATNHPPQIPFKISQA